MTKKYFLALVVSFVWIGLGQSFGADHEGGGGASSFGVDVSPVFLFSEGGMRANYGSSGSATPTQTDFDVYYGSGALFGVPFMEGWSIEVGVLYNNKEFQALPSGGSNSYVLTPYIDIPVQVRYWWMDMFSIGLGGYYSFKIGRSVVGLLGQSPTSIGGTGTTLGVTSSDLGLVGSLQLKYPVTERAKILLDYRYLFGLLDVMQASGVTGSYSTMQLLVGLSFKI